MIDFHYWPTPNGHKVTLFLEEAGLDYTIHPVNIGKGDQFKPEYLAFSPNNKMPAIIDRAPADGGEPQSVFESGAILLYLAEKSGQFLSTDPRARIETLEWLFWQMAGLGPMTGQYGHFNVYAPEKIPYAIDRYTNEANRLLQVLDTHLKGRDFIAGDAYSIADMATYPWIGVYDKAPIDMTPYPEVQRWHAAIKARPATERAYARAKDVNPDAGKTMSDEEKKLLFGQGRR
ncbi:glutathione binding-like protein [Luteimonas fraxinea]|uniref:Glutathione binding-like protein n=1 Tax=Luteimonas fraxinea TaxID=2901869 RepID=A0ABS8UA07_9GAMM|nr:glutathione binding-like protein [Luteimonas fraxinea]MCD9095463.1 glutathione binding-like protein [Luteimonas fraxinea]UHH11331.1 glutathione binding-like protein [Luteimonas fraxinea]